MTNLSAILQAYFIDISVSEICGSISNIKSNPYDMGMPEASFKKHFLKHNSNYGTDVVTSIHEYASNYWMKQRNNSNDPNGVFNILRNATKGILLWDESGENLACKYNEFLKWNDISSIVGEDIFTTSYLANKSVEDNHQIESFAWKPHLISDSKEVNEIIHSDLYEQHFHMYGSSLCFAINWIAAMNDCSEVNKKKKILNGFDENLAENIIKAAAIRLFLFNHLFNANLNTKETDIIAILQAQNIQEINALFLNFKNTINVARSQDVLDYDGFVFDYAITHPITDNDILRYYNIPLIGERKLLYKAFKKIYSCDETFKDYKTYFYIYLVIKNKTRQFFIQDCQTKGFSRFQNYDRRKNLLIKDGTNYWDIFCFVAAQTTANNQTMKGLEMRIVPSLDSQKMAETIKDNNANINKKAFFLEQENLIAKNKQKLGYILHFIKENDKKDLKKFGIYCRNERLRDKLDKQASAIARLIATNSMYIQGGVIPQRKIDQKDSIYPIIGIDAANSEFGCRPEVFATVFRRLKYVHHSNRTDYLYNRKNNQLGRTFHVAEDYYDIVDGLRAIDECIFYLNFGEEDRLGHCVALGIEPQRYYKTRNYTIILPKQILLDNAVWFLFKMDEYSIPDSNGLKKRLKDVFHLYFSQIYQGFNGTIEDYYSAWKLRGDDPRASTHNDSYLKPYLLNKIDPELDLLRENKTISSLYRAYHSCEQRTLGEELVEFQLKDSDVWVIRDLQKFIREEISRKKISIETNPTSNKIITDVERYSKHPILQFNNYGLCKSEQDNACQIDVSINTDDQGVFATSLEKEFTLMACALEKKRNDEDGKPTYEPKDIYRWLDDIRRSARRSSFFKDS
jgi:acid stress-induced BolA-like protein IbaG/YrbA